MVSTQLKMKLTSKLHTISRLSLFSWKQGYYTRMQYFPPTISTTQIMVLNVMYNIDEWFKLDA